MKLMLLLILLPIIAGVINLLIPSRVKFVKEAVTLLAAAVNLGIVFMLYKTDIAVAIPWGGYGIEFALRNYQFSSFILLAIAGFSILLALYSSAFMSGKPSTNQFYSYFLITLGLSNGAVLANNLVFLLFFWESLMLTMFGMIMIGGKDSWKTAIKAFVLVGVADLCLMLGVALTGYLAKTFTISSIHLQLDTLGAAAYILMMTGAIAKAGSMPFHSWIPDAAKDAPLPFMAFLPAALEKLLGIYFLTRISLDMFKLDPSSWVSPLVMTVGLITILLPVMMALVQKDYKRLLSYHAISQVGYMILGIGTAVPAGIVGGVFHMINHALYKSTLFLTGGAVEKQAGTTDLSKLGGLAKLMPVTFACFLVAALSISGVPPFNGFFSKELVYDGALERGWIFYAGAILGSFLTAASFLKLGHAAYFGKLEEKNKSVKEAPVSMLVPMVIIAGVCIFFGLFNAFPIEKFIVPVLGHVEHGHHFAGWPASTLLVVLTVVVLIAAVLNHLWGVKRTGKGLGAADHIHYAPVLSGIYDKAEKRMFDPYNIGITAAYLAAGVLYAIDRAVDWIYERLSVVPTLALSDSIKKAHNGNFSVYVIWSLAGALIVLLYVLR